MANVLEKIVIDTRSRIKALKQQKPLSSFKDGLEPSQRCLYQALSAPEAGFILECKKASPSKGLIRPEFNIEEIADVYRHYAAGISVLTDEKYFQGSYQYLQTVTQSATCPVLNKDFFVDEYQVYLARYYGADAILLMLSVLTDDEYRRLATVAESLNLAILTEISNETEKERAIALGSKLIGINNRNLRDLSTDINRTFELVKGIPDDRLIISESGIYTNEQVRLLAPAVNGFLVGSSLMAEHDLDLACRKLIYGNHKVCGLTDIDYANYASEAGAVYGGLIFAPKSPRCIDLTKARAIVETNPHLHYVGVFVDHDINDVCTIAQTLNLFAVQLHGNEDEHYIAQLKAQMPSCVQIWQARAVVEKLPELSTLVDGYVLDGKNPGSGKQFNWSLLADGDSKMHTALLAGGISPENITDALAQVQQSKLKGLDINSGVESAPGTKDRQKLISVFNAIRHY